MKIYVACLTKTNQIAHREWLETDGMDCSDFHQSLNRILNRAPSHAGRKWKIDNSEGYFNLISENTPIDQLIEITRLLTAYGNAYAAYCQVVGQKYATEQAFENSYQGTWESEQDFAEQLWRDQYEIPEYLEDYINWESITEDTFLNDYTSHELDGELHVFSNG